MSRAVVVSDFPSNWRELSGENDWEGLLDTYNKDFRRVLINYGERAASTEYAFCYKQVNDCLGFSRFSEQHFFDRLGVNKNSVIPYKYDVKKFIYWGGSGSESAWSAWCGYVAMANDEAKTLLGRRDIVVVWRGTMLNAEWWADANPWLVSPDLILEASTAKVHRGFYYLYTTAIEGPNHVSGSARDQVLKVLKELLAQYEDEDVSITVVGFSLGAAVATLNAADIVANGYNTYNTVDGLTGSKTVPVTAFAFASPKVGDANFQKAFDALKDLHLLRIVHVSDPIPTLPDLEIYQHVGSELDIDTSGSEDLNERTAHPTDRMINHRIDIYLHGCDGYQGVGIKFDREVQFDIALLNRKLDALASKYQHNIPVNWWCAENKDMIQGEDGTFKLKPDFYVP